MPEFSRKSKSILMTCHPDIRAVMERIVQYFDCTILCGRRGETEQEQLFWDGKSKAHFGESPHNYGESFAVDVVPYPIDWEDRERMTFFAGQIIATARSMGIDLKWGGDWDSDTHLSDNRFDDLPHFEFSDWRQRR